MAERLSNLETTPFYDGPAEFLCRTIADTLKTVDEFALIFGDNIDAYRRMDYGIRTLPAIRVYNNQSRKDFDSWFIEGDVIVDLIMPASLRRNELQQVQDTLTAAIVQQFRRPTFFDSIESGVPGLNELGKRVISDKALGFEWGDNVVPLTQITINFRIDLREWDNYLTSTNRTKDSPFVPTLGDLQTIITTIEGWRDTTASSKELSISMNQKG